MLDNEDKRQAAGMAIGVSNQVMVASLTMLTILGAVFVFIMDKRSITPAGVILVGLAGLLFVISVSTGAKGVAKVYRKGHEGEWHYSNGNPQFQLQVLTAIVGVILFPIAIAFMGEPPANSSPLDITPRLQRSLDSLFHENYRKDIQFQELARTVDSLRKDATYR